MESIAIKNFRCFVETGDIGFNKVNILLGKNSSGKSSFLNLFPMFKESVKNELRSPLMWFNEGIYDFGSFSNTFCRYSKIGEPIVFEFSWDAISEKNGPQCEECGLFDRVLLGLLNSNRYRFKISINCDEKGDYLEDVSLDSGKHNLRVHCSKARSLTFYLDDILLKSSGAVWDYEATGLLPNIRFRSRYQPYNSVRRHINSLIPDTPQVVLKNADYEKLYNIPSLDSREIYAYYEQNRTDNPFMDFILKAHKADSKEFLKFCRDIYLSNIIYALLYADRYLSMSFEGISYILPVRYAFGRYIRNKNLAVGNVEPSGANVMEFLLSLKKKEMVSFNSLVEKVLGVTVSVEGDENKSIFVKSKLGKDNIVDVGYGYTQILPIITVLWNIARQKNSCEFPSIVIIEQPEVHLHPSLQGDVAKLIVEVMSLAKSNDSDMQIFVETHSEAFVNRMGKYVRLNSADSDQGIASENVSIFLFEKKENGATITPTGFDSDGYIQKWPIGFLN